MSSHLDYRGDFLSEKSQHSSGNQLVPSWQKGHIARKLYTCGWYITALHASLLALSSPQLLTLLITCYSIPYYSDSVRVSVSVSLSSILYLLLSHCLYCSLLLSCFPNSGHVQPAAAMFTTFSLYSLIFTIETLTISWSSHVMSAVLLLLLFCLLLPPPHTLSFFL